jgi:hypothetical protein
MDLQGLGGTVPEKMKRSGGGRMREGCEEGVGLGSVEGCE